MKPYMTLNALYVSKKREEELNITDFYNELKQI